MVTLDVFLASRDNIIQFLNQTIKSSFFLFLRCTIARVILFLFIVMCLFCIYWFKDGNLAIQHSHSCYINSLKDIKRSGNCLTSAPIPLVWPSCNAARLDQSWITSWTSTWFYHFPHLIYKLSFGTKLFSKESYK